MINKIAEIKKTKTGRPSKFDQINKLQLKKLVEAGWTDEQVSDFFGVATSTLKVWRSKHKEFSATIEASKEIADLKVEKSIYELACGYSHPIEQVLKIPGKIVRVSDIKHYPPNVTACMFWLRNRKPKEWRDKASLISDEPDDPEFLRKFFGFNFAKGEK